MVHRDRRSRGVALAASAVVLALAALVPGAAEADEDGFSVADAAAKTDAETADGKRFAESLGQAFGREHGRTIQGCAEKTKPADLSNFDLLLRVDGAGVVDKALVKPATPLAACVESKMRGWKTSAPPHAGFWLKVEVNLKSK